MYEVYAGKMHLSTARLATDIVVHTSRQIKCSRHLKLLITLSRPQLESQDLTQTLIVMSTRESSYVLVLPKCQSRHKHEGQRP